MNDVTKLEDISDFVDEERKPLKIKSLSSGNNHTIATFDYGSFFIWGDNLKGQLGNWTRVFVESPFPFPKFENKHRILHVVCSRDNCGVIVERLPEDKRDKDVDGMLKRNGERWKPD